MNAGEVLAEVARAVWHDTHDGAECPDEAIPTSGALCEWLAESPDDAMTEANARLAAVVPGQDADPLPNGSTLPQWAVLPLADNPALVAIHTAWPAPSGTDAIPSEWRRNAQVLSLLPHVHAAWCNLPKADRPRHPLAPLVAAWQARPVEVTANTRTDRARILPAQLAMFAAPPNDARGRLFSAPSRGGGSSQLPLFEAGSPGGEYITPALPLALYELGVNQLSPGPGAPLALRLFVEAILAAPLAGRELGQPIALTEVSVRYVLSRLYPNRTPRPNEWRPLIEAARATLASEDAAIVWGDGVPRSAVLITSFPEHLDDPVRIIVDLPRGAVHGPQVSERLHLYGPQRGRHYRALLNLAYWWHEPGRTLVPAGRGGHWLQVQDPKRYRTPTDTELVNLVFPTSTRQQRRNLVHEAAKVIAELAKDGELRIVGKRLLPPSPTDGGGKS